MIQPAPATAADQLHLAHYLAVLRLCQQWRISIKTLLLLLRIARRGEKGLSTNKMLHSERISMRVNRPWESRGAFLAEEHGPKPRGPDAWRLYRATPDFCRHLCPLETLGTGRPGDCPDLGPKQAGIMKNRLSALHRANLGGAHLSILIHGARDYGLLRSRQSGEPLPWSRADEMRGFKLKRTLNELLHLGIVTVTKREVSGGLNLHIQTDSRVRDWLLTPDLSWPILQPQPELTW